MRPNLLTSVAHHRVCIAKKHAPRACHHQGPRDRLPRGRAPVCDQNPPVQWLCRELPQLSVLAHVIRPLCRQRDHRRLPCAVQPLHHAHRIAHNDPFRQMRHCHRPRIQNNRPDAPRHLPAKINISRNPHISLRHNPAALRLVTPRQGPPTGRTTIAGRVGHRLTAHTGLQHEPPLPRPHSHGHGRPTARRRRHMAQINRAQRVFLDRPSHNASNTAAPEQTPRS